MLKFSSLCESWRFIRQNEVSTYMFYLKPRDDVTFEQLHSASTLGKLDICWMSGFGERGRLQTNQLPKPVIILLFSFIYSFSPIHIRLHQSPQLIPAIYLIYV